jgi:hypothetical protein
MLNLDMEVLENCEAPIDTLEGVGYVMIALGTGILVGLAIT